MSAHDPLSLFRAAADALERGDWPAVAALCDPASLAGFKRQLVDQYARAEPPHDVTVEDLLRHEPGMPREVAEYYVRRIDRYRERERPFDELPGIPDAEALVAASPERVFAAWLDGRSPAREFERVRAAGEIPDEVADEVAEALRSEWRFVALGAAPASDRIAYVVFHDVRDPAAVEMEDEDPAGARDVSPEERALEDDLAAVGFARLAPCRLQPDCSWRLLVGYDFLDLGAWGVVASDVSVDVTPSDPEDRGAGQCVRPAVISSRTSHLDD